MINIKGTEFELDLYTAVVQTPLKSMIFPIEDRGTVKTVSYTELDGKTLNNPSLTSRFIGKTFDADINTYYHSDKEASMCLAENIIWKNKPDWFTEEFVDRLKSDVESRNLRVQKNSLPIFFIVSRKINAIWGIHRDSIPLRIHHAIKSSGYSIRFFNDNREIEEIIHFKENESYLLNVTRLHNVYSDDDSLRVHIVIDCEKNNEF